MSLDMYVYRLHKPDKTTEELSRLTTYDSLFIPGYTTFSEDYDLPPDFDNIREATVKFFFVSNEVDYEKLKKDFNIPQDARCLDRLADDPLEIACRCEFRDNHGDSCRVHITRAELQRYQCDGLRVGYAVIEEKLASWRGHDYVEFLQSICEASDMLVHDGGYYPLNRKMLTTIAKRDPEACDNIVQHFENENDLIVFQYCW